MKPSETEALPEHVRDTVEAIASLHEEHRRGGTPFELLAGRLTSFAGRPGFIRLILIIAAGWIGANLVMGRMGLAPLDPPPFFWLQGVTSFSALLMTVLILTNGRREDQLSELRQQLILELAILAEKRAAKTLERLETLRRDLPSVANAADAVADALAEPSDPALVAEALKETRQRPPDED